MSRRFRTHYDNLKVSRDAPPEVIRSAYKALANKYHPDRHHGSERALRAMQAINTSFEALDDPVRRKAHDDWIDRKAGNAAPPQQQASAPRPQYTPPKKQPPYTHAPPPKPLFEPNIGCFYWILGFIVIGLLGSLDECSKRNSRSSAVAPSPTPTPLPTPTPAPPKPVQQLKAPFGIKWGETEDRIRRVLTNAGAKVVGEQVEGYLKELEVTGIEQKSLARAFFRFANSSLSEVELHFDEKVWGASPPEEWFEWVVQQANDKHGEGYRFRNVESEALGISKRSEGWAWVQDSGALRMVLTTHAAQGVETPKYTLYYSSSAFPGHQANVYLKDDDLVAPLQIKTESGSNYLIKLVDAATRADVMRMHVAGGQEANFLVPLGDYEVLFASGQNWYGNELLFGPETRYAKADAVASFTSKASPETRRQLNTLKSKLEAATKALRDYMVRNKFSKDTIAFIFDGRDPEDNLQGPDRLDTDWWLQNVLNKIGKQPKLYNGLVDRLNARSRAANEFYKLSEESGGYEGVSLTLYAVRGGNLDTPPITPEEFFGSDGVATP